MAHVRPPGVYSENAEQQFSQVRLAPSGIPAFIGVTRKGPMNVPLRVRSHDRFIEEFGTLDVGSYLDDAVRGFFENGGRECFVMRVARVGPKGRGEVARIAGAKIRDAAGKPCLAVDALNEGTWGNDIQVTIRRSPPRVETFLTMDLREGDCEATIRSTHGFQVGTIVRIFDGDKETYRWILDVQGKTIHWIGAEPLEHNFSSGQPTYVQPVEFELVVETPHERETYREASLALNSPNNIVRTVYETSRLIRMTTIKTDTPFPDAFPVDTAGQALSGGADGLFNVGPDDFIGMSVGPDRRYGLVALEMVDEVDLLAAPDLPWCLAHSEGFRTAKDVEIVQHAMVDHCERLRNRFAILDAIDPRSPELALQWRLMFDSAYGAVYFPWVVVRSPAGELRTVPPSGHVAGVYARCDQADGSFRAPANEELRGIVDLELVLQEDDIGRLNHRGVNCLKIFPARGIRIWGARTLSTDPMLRYLNVRRTLNTIIRSLNADLQWVVFEPNGPRLWKTVTRNVTYFLSQLWEKGYFKGRTPEDSFYVQCDHETNPASSREAGQLIVEVGVAPVRPAEFISFRVEQAMPDQDTAPGVETS